MMTQNKNLCGALFAAALLATTVSAGTAAKKSLSWSKKLGCSEANIQVQLDAEASREYGSGYERTKVSSELEATVNIFSGSIEAARIYGGVSTSASHGSSLSASVRVGGKTLYSSIGAGPSGISKTFSKSFGPYDIFPTDLTATFYPFGIPVTVASNCGVEAELGMELRGRASTVTASGGGYAWGEAYGWISFGVGFSWAGLGLIADVSLAKTKISLGLEASPSSVGGYLDLAITPVSVLLRFYMRLIATAYAKIFEWDCGTISHRIRVL